MKLTKTYYDQIIKQINCTSLSVEDFSFVKKKGWVYVKYIDNAIYFSFFRKKIVNISNDHHQWEKQDIFKVKTTSTQKAVEASSWSHVLQLFASWLNEI